MKRIDLVYFEAGGGHRAAANALKVAIEEQGRPWEVRLVNIQEILDPLDVFRRLLGRRLQDVYNQLLRRGWTLGTSQLCVMMHAAVRTSHRQQVRLIERQWRSSRPDLVVSLIPNFNRSLRQSLKNICPAAPFVTILTDMADYPPHFWIERQDQFLICGSGRAVEQAQEHGYNGNQIFRVSGMILHPRFYKPITLDRAAERKRLGLDPATATGLVMFGGEGSKAMFNILQRLERSSLDLQLIMICGRNQNLARQLQEHQGRLRVFVEGFTAEVPYYMHLSDFFVGKPGPGSISEALQMRLPVVVQCNAWTLPQERYNTVWVRQTGTGVVLPGFHKIVEAVARLLEPGVLDGYRAKAAAVRNRAIFEVTDILEQLLAKA